MYVFIHVRMSVVRHVMGSLCSYVSCISFFRSLFIIYIYIYTYMYIYI